jgi:hypothetical protein
VTERDPHRWARFAASVAVLFVVAVIVPVGLIAASRSRFGSANPLAGADPPWAWGSDGVTDALSRPIGDDTVIDGLVRLSLCIVWVAVAVIVVTTIVEVVHALRHHGLAVPDVRGVGWAQSIARFIAVGLIAVVPMLTPATSLAATLGARSVATSPFDASTAATPAAGWAPSHAEAVPNTPSSEAAGAVHVVTAGESIYSIALGLAGRDSSRVLEIADVIIDANLGTVMPGGQRFTNPAYIEVGWTLQLPAGVAPPERDDVVATTYVVEPGDTLWDIADEQLGDPTSWTEIWERNAGDDMGDGRTFDDPNLILPGWELDLAENEPVAADVDVALDLDVDVPTELPEPAPQPSFPHREPDTGVRVPSLDESVANGPLPLAPTPTPTPGPMTSVDSTSTSTTVVAPTDPSGAGDHRPSADTPAPEAPSPIRLEHAALLAAGILALVGVRRRQRLRAAMPRHRVPEPRPEVTRTERKLRTVDAGERVLRADVACRAAARSLIGTGSQIGWVELSPDGGLELRLTAPATLPSPWSGGDQSWNLRADVPVEMLGEDARQVGQPCVALVQLGLTSAGNELLVDLEACGVLAVVARAGQADEVVTALATALASSLFAEVAHLVVVSLPRRH